MSGSPLDQPLNPHDFLERSALVYPDKVAICYNEQLYTYRQFHQRVNRLAGALKAAGIQKGDRVAYLSPNVPAMLEGHFGPMRMGAVLVTINIRLSPGEVAYILNHSGAKALVFDSEFAPVVRTIRDEIPDVSTLVQIVDTVPRADDIPSREYEEFLSSAPEGDHRVVPDSESETITINYTSGTTGLPKGVQYTGRGAYLNALGEALEMDLRPESVYLWTVPMFHCNGWCFTWAVTAMGGTHVCLRRVDPGEIFRLVRERGVTHMGGAPTVLIAMYSSPAAEGERLDGLSIVAAGAPPAPPVIRTMEGMGAIIHHVYGLTETYGPHTICTSQPHWQDLSIDELAAAKARQGVPYIIANTNLIVADDECNEVPRDGETVGEVMMRGSNVMAGYFRDPDATAEAFRHGWFHSGDMAVWHPDGYIEVMDRAKDVIISGGENISSQQVEKVLMEHPAVLEVAVVATPDSYWGESVKAFVTLAPGETAEEDEVIAFCRERLARFKCPKSIAFGDLPKTATGKIQKYVLRDREWQGYEKRVH